MTSTNRWLSALARLRVDRSTGDPAPHKPLMLLVVFDLAETGQLADDILLLTGELTFRLTQYWVAVAGRRKQPPDIRLPFHHLGSDGIWQPLTSAGQLSPDRKLTTAARLDPEFVKFAQDPTCRDRARRLLIATYFPLQERLALYASAGLATPDDFALVHTPGYEPAVEVAKGRSARFRTSIVAAYDYTCALTRQRLVTVAAGSLVDAAHIHRFADSRDDDIQNGLALSKNAHWLFDAGLWTLTDEFRVVIAAEHYFEDAPDQKPLLDYQGSHLQLPADPRFRPRAKNLSHHRKTVFRGLIAG